MTSLFGKLLRLFPESVPLEDLFTEALARLFERRPELCLAWLKDAGLLSSEEAMSLQETYVRVWSQRPLAPLEHHDTGSRLDFLIEVHWPFEELADEESMADVVILESKIGSGEADGQLRRYAEHLARMTGMRKTLVYITRAYDPKKEEEILAGTQGVEFCQLRWHDFYRFLQEMEADALVEEVMTFMEEQGMARSYRFSTTDLMALSGVPRAFEIFDETFGEEVQAELEAFAGNRINRREPFGLTQIRDNKRYIVLAPLDKGDLYCYASYECRASDGYPMVKVYLEAAPNAAGKDASVGAMRQIALRDEWNETGLDEPTGFVRVSRGRSLASLLYEEDHVAAVKRFFIESIRQLREELTAFKKDHPELPWAGG